MCALDMCIGKWCVGVEGKERGNFSYPIVCSLPLLTPLIYSYEKSIKYSTAKEWLNVKLPFASTNIGTITCSIHKMSDLNFFLKDCNYLGNRTEPNGLSPLKLNVYKKIVLYA